MNTLKKLRGLVVISIVLCAAYSSYGMYSVSHVGTWPGEWPKELETLRKQSRSLMHSTVAVYEIPFTSREDFESAWPHIVGLKSKGAVIFLRGSPDERLGETITAGVRILSPLTGQSVWPVGTNFRSSEFPLDQKTVKALADVSVTVGPPWPKQIMSESGVLPEYVINENGKWSAYQEIESDSESERLRKRLEMKRARLDIELIVDGDIVDLNRISLPADTPIIDKRFESRNNESRR